jgi:hypothetical protein
LSKQPSLHSPASPIIDALEAAEKDRGIHAHGGIPFTTMRRLEQLLPDQMENTAETGCGRSTIFFSQASKNHTAFCLDDKEYGENSSIKYFESSKFYNEKTVACILGPTQNTLPKHTHSVLYDCVLIDGPHGYPFPDLEYYQFYPHIKPGGFLLIDDVQIPTIGRMADVLQEDTMWNLIELVATTAVFQRTDTPNFTTDGDHWWEQDYNRRRANPNLDFYLNDGGEMTSFAEKLLIQEQLKAEQKKQIAAARQKKKKKHSIWKRLLNKT